MFKKKIWDSRVNRGDFLKTGVGLALAAGGVSLFAEDHSHHGAGANVALIDVASACAKAGKRCIDHCIELVKAGDTTIAQCLDSATEMSILCDGLASLAAARSRHLPAYAKICIAACEDCAKECKKHASKHAECKACMDSCNDCIQACKKIAA